MKRQHVYAIAWDERQIPDSHRKIYQMNNGFNHLSTTAQRSCAGVQSSNGILVLYVQWSFRHPQGSSTYPGFNREEGGE